MQQRQEEKARPLFRRPAVTAHTTHTQIQKQGNNFWIIFGCEYLAKNTCKKWALSPMEKLEEL